MPSTTNTNPDDVLQALLAEPRRSNVHKTLQALHELCRRLYQAGYRDFRISSIGRKAEEAGLFVSRILYNPSSRPYKDLITAWGAYAGPPVVIPKKRALASYDYLMRIEDPSIRMIMQGVISERDSLKAELNIVKGSHLGTVDMRPGRADRDSQPNAGSEVVVIPDANLTEGERDALWSAISPQFLEDQGWEEGERGEIKKGLRIVFKHGFTSAIRKLLRDGPQRG
jgi:hypothetical protein